MEGWYQTDWFGGDWNSAQWFGADGVANGVTFDAPLIEGVGTVSSSGVTGTGSVGIAAPEIDGTGSQRRRGGGKSRAAIEEERLREHWLELDAEEEMVLSAIMAFVEIEEAEWELLPTA